MRGRRRRSQSEEGRMHNVRARRRRRRRRRRGKGQDNEERRQRKSRRDVPVEPVSDLRVARDFCRLAPSAISSYDANVTVEEEMIGDRPAAGPDGHAEDGGSGAIEVARLQEFDDPHLNEQKTRVHVSVYLPPSLRPCLPACLPASLPACLPPSLPACLPASAYLEGICIIARL
eukprot:756855-Hanusia_phi.AAC.3